MASLKHLLVGEQGHSGFVKEIHDRKGFSRRSRAKRHWLAAEAQDRARQGRRGLSRPQQQSNMNKKNITVWRASQSNTTFCRGCGQVQGNVYLETDREHCWASCMRRLGIVCCTAQAEVACPPQRLYIPKARWAPSALDNATGLSDSGPGSRCSWTGLS